MPTECLQGSAFATALLLALWGGLACSHGDGRRLRGASHAAGRAVARGDTAAVRGQVLPGARARLDVVALSGEYSKAWGQALKRPDEVRPAALVFVAPQELVAAQWTPDGWRFSVDPTDVYAQDTPRQALRAFVRASRAGRWDVLLRLAPRRYRVGLSVERLETAWTQGERAQVLQEARDRLAAHLADPIVADAHEAALDLGEEHVVRLEREGDRWVVVDL